MHAVISRRLFSSLLLLCLCTACSSHSFKLRQPFEQTNDGFWFRADCKGYCILDDEGAEKERLHALEQMLGKHNSCPSGYVIDVRTPLAATKTAPPDIVVYEGRCRP